MTHKANASQPLNPSFPHLKLDLSSHNDTLGLHAPDVSLLADGDEGLHLLPK